MKLQWNSTSLRYVLTIETLELSEHDKLAIHIKNAIRRRIVSNTAPQPLRIAIRRKKRKNYTRNNWDAILFDNKDDPWFLRHIRMSIDSFQRLVLLIKDDLQINTYMASKRNGEISPSLCLFMTLRYLAGGKVQDIAARLGVSRSSFYRCVKKTLVALTKCSALQIKFPQTLNECEARAEGFTRVSRSEAIVNCVSVVDGIHIRIKPPTNYVGNVRSYFSGHHYTIGINMQAACDEECRFTYVAIAGPGSANDRAAVKETKLYELMDNMPEGYVVIGDAAYEPTERLIPLFYGVKHSDAFHDNFNYYGSKLRVHIEMAFGMMVNKWPILHHSLQCAFCNIRYVLMSIVALHNYCINERIAKNDHNPFNKFTWSYGEQIVDYIPSVKMTINLGEGDPEAPEDDPYLYRFTGHSYTRHEMAHRVQDMKLVRP
jgi:hypothetical protein